MKSVICPPTSTDLSHSKFDAHSGATALSAVCTWRRITA
jgi:hypothetical protein